MIVETTIARRQVKYRDKSYRLCYRLITEDHTRHSIEVVCSCKGEVERERVWVDGTKEEVQSILRLFARETVFPIALKETLENFR